MRRILLFLVVVVVLVSVLAIPAFASSSGTYTAIHNGNGYTFDAIPLGTIYYDVYFYTFDGSIFVCKNVSLDDLGDCYEFFVSFDDEWYTSFLLYINFDSMTIDGGLLFGDSEVETIVFKPSSPSESAEPVDLLGIVSDRLGDVISWVKTIVHELVAADGHLHGLLPFVGIAVAISVVFVVVKIVHIFI